MLKEMTKLPTHATNDDDEEEPACDFLTVPCSAYSVCSCRSPSENVLLDHCYFRSYLEPALFLASLKRWIRVSTTAGSASVEVSPILSSSPAAT